MSNGGVLLEFIYVITSFPNTLLFTHDKACASMATGSLERLFLVQRAVVYANALNTYRFTDPVSQSIHIPLSEHHCYLSDK
jgi:hypothetical protein